MIRYGCTVGRLVALSATLYLMSAAPGHAATSDEWVLTGSPTGSVAGDLIVLADGTPLLFGVGPGGVQQ
jgi:hypothetical protein